MTHTSMQRHAHLDILIPFPLPQRLLDFNKIALACAVFTNIGVSPWHFNTRFLQPIINHIIPFPKVFYLADVCWYR